MMAPGGMRFPPHMPPYVLNPDERMELDPSGNVNWRRQWIKELEHLRELTENREKEGVNDEWYKMMFVRVRTALFIDPGDGSMGVHQMLPAPGNPVD